MTQPRDAAAAAELGAAYVGVVFAPSKRRVTPRRAAEILASVGGGTVRRVGVFGQEPLDEVLATADIARLDVLQLHGPRGAGDVAALAAGFDGELWTVARVGDGAFEAPAVLGAVHGLLLDSWSAGALGGTGEAFDWRAVSESVRRIRARGGVRLIVAGGLHAGNVGEVRRVLDPDVVDVSSGIESAVGIKDHERMRAFVAAAHSALHP